MPSSVIEEVTFDLREGENKFTVEVDSLNETDTYFLTVVRDTIPPVISIEERVNRTTTLAQTRVVEGVCEGVPMYWYGAKSTQSRFYAPHLEPFL